MFERFTERARFCLACANQEAQRLNHEYIGTEHILLGLVREENGIAARILRGLNADLARVRIQVEKLARIGAPLPDNVKRPRRFERSWQSMERGMKREI
jgi:ATP-dependent Clp protease ATP-binding subunit ClpC